MRLSGLLDTLGVAAAGSCGDPEISGIAYDSRVVRPGQLFVAIHGYRVDGAAFVQEAFSRGAAAAVVSGSGEAAGLPETDARVVAVTDTRAALATLAAAYHGNPARSLCTIGVTGTDGKTTTSYFTAAVLEAGGLRTGLFTTVAYKVGGAWEQNDSRQTTPEAPEVQALLRRMVDGGDSCAVLESTSHGLALHKLDCCDYDIAVFTNLSPDHLDFHQTYKEYRAAKGRLFALQSSAPAKRYPKFAVLNADDAAAGYMAACSGLPKLTYAVDGPADFRVERLSLHADGSDVVVATPAGPLELHLQLPGRFNVYNALAAAAVGVGLGLKPESVALALNAATGVPGRMQRIEAGQPFTVIVDYAHTAASFEKVLQTLRPLTRGRLIAVFGCAGERGAERRTGMGSVAAHGADYTILTTEDPRGEDPEAIIAQIAAAMSAAGAREGRSFERVSDRRAAITRAFMLAAPGDVVLLTGKGHERSIEVARGKLPWDEAAVARELLRGQDGNGRTERG